MRGACSTDLRKPKRVAVSKAEEARGRNTQENHMQRKVAAFAAFLGLIARNTSAQTVKDVRSVLEASLKAMGGANLKTIRYSASGWSSRIGQTYGLAEDWPHYEVADYTRAIDYDAKWSREDYTRRQGRYPLLGR